MAKIIELQKYRERPGKTVLDPNLPTPPQPLVFDFTFDKEQYFIEQLITTYSETEEGHDLEACDLISAWSAMIDCLEMSIETDRLAKAFRIGFKEIALPKNTPIQKLVKNQLKKCQIGDPVSCLKSGAISIFWGAY